MHGGIQSEMRVRVRVRLPLRLFSFLSRGNKENRESHISGEGRRCMHRSDFGLSLLSSPIHLTCEWFVCVWVQYGEGITAYNNYLFKKGKHKKIGVRHYQNKLTAHPS